VGSQLNRRDFLKLISLVPFLHLNLPYFVGEPERSSSEEGLPNILILVFDALSAEHTSLNGYRRETTPNLARFAQNATVFHSHYAGGNFTSSGTSSILTGTYPWSHRALHIHGTVEESFQDRNLFSLFARRNYYRIAYSHNLLVTSLLHQFNKHLDALVKTRELCLVDDQIADQLFPKDFSPAFWAEWLVFRGGETYPSSLFLSFFHRLYRYFHKREITQKYGQLFPRGIPNLHNLFFILEDAIDWILAQLSTMPRPYLAYFHLLPPHEPYTTRREFVDIFKDGWIPPAKPEYYFSQGHSDKDINRARREYDEYLAYADAEFGRLYDFMLETNILNNTCVIITSDHGEMFERGIIGHVTPTLYKPVIHVPLIISRPGQDTHQDVYSATSCVDLIPTLLHMTGQPLPEWLEGGVLPTFSDTPLDGERTIYAVEAKSNAKYGPLAKGTVTMLKDRYKLTHYFGYDQHDKAFDLFDLGNDPEELNDLYGLKKSLSEELQKELIAKISEVNQPYRS